MTPIYFFDCGCCDESLGEQFRAAIHDEVHDCLQRFEGEDAQNRAAHAVTTLHLASVFGGEGFVDQVVRYVEDEHVAEWRERLGAMVRRGQR